MLHTSDLTHAFMEANIIFLFQTSLIPKSIQEQRRVLMHLLCSNLYIAVGDGMVISTCKNSCQYQIIQSGLATYTIQRIQQFSSLQAY